MSRFKELGWGEEAGAILPENLSIEDLDAAGRAFMEEWTSGFSDRSRVAIDSTATQKQAAETESGK